MLKEQHRLFRTILVATDVAIVTASIVLAYVLRFEIFRGFEHPSLSWLAPSVRHFTYETHALPLACMPVMMFALFYAGLYKPRRDQRFLREAWVIVKAVVVGTVLAMAMVYLFRKSFYPPAGTLRPGEAAEARVIDPSRMQFAVFGALCAAFLLSWRFSFRSALRSLRRRGWNLRHVAIIGTGRLAQVVFHTLERNSWTGIKPACFISHHENPVRDECCGLPVLGGLRDLPRLMEEQKGKIAGVFIALPQRMASELPRLLARLERHPIDVRIVPDVNPRYTPFSMATSQLEGMPILTVRQSPMHGWGRIFKRAVDLCGAVIALIIFAPLMAAIAALVRLSGPGPVMFRQPRASLGGRTFMIYKFRTMTHVAAEKQQIRDLGRGTDAWTTPNDPRITRVGRILRRTSLDELPQLFNVLLGEMSLVGPRPERPELIARFREDWRGYMLRQHVKAGMTGWAQVNGLRGDTSLRKRLQYDLFYIRNWSLRFDFRILWLTVFRGFVHPNAQ